MSSSIATLAAPGIGFRSDFHALYVFQLVSRSRAISTGPTPSFSSARFRYSRWAILQAQSVEAAGGDSLNSPHLSATQGNCVGVYAVPRILASACKCFCLGFVVKASVGVLAFFQVHVVLLKYGYIIPIFRVGVKYPERFFLIVFGENSNA